MALGPKQMGEAILKNLKTKTGKSIDEWIAVVGDSGKTEKKELIQFLKKEKGLGHFQAVKIVEHFNGIDMYANAQSFEENLFDTSALKKRYESLKSEILGLGPNVRVQPCKTYIPFYRKNQFAILTKKGNDIILGLNLPDNYSGDGFEESPHLGGERITHRSRIADSFTSDQRRGLSLAFKNN